MYILGLNAFHGDASAALLQNGHLVSAIEEERFNRVKHWAGFPVLAAEGCLKGVDRQGLSHVAVSRNPRAHIFHKLLRVAGQPGSWRRVTSRAKNTIRIAGVANIFKSSLPGTDHVRVHHVEHHRAHLASTFFASPFEEAAVVSIDGFGDFNSLMWGVGSGSRLRLVGSVRFPHSLGLFYSAFTQFLGFPKYGDEYKMMGLSAYGEPRFVPQVREVVRSYDDQVRLNLDYFTHHRDGVAMTWDGGEPEIGNVYSPKMIAAFGAPRVPRTEIEPRHADIAASVQAVLEEQYFAILNFVHRRTRLPRLCLAGGVALNCAANGKIFEKTPFQEVYIQPASHDAGTSIGAALYVWHQLLNRPRSFVMRHVYYGPGYETGEIERALNGAELSYQHLQADMLVEETARAIADGKVVGWFQGRMEFGPRALGNRSILADPRRSDMKDILNKRIKFREPFRPFCPSVPREALTDYFEVNQPSPFMVQAYRIKPEMRARIPAVTHQDGTGRLQTVEKDVNPLFWELLNAFGRLTGVPVLINTSFNENEPIVNTPQEALDCFLRTNMDVLVMGSFMVSKAGASLGNATRAAGIRLASA